MTQTALQAFLTGNGPAPVGNGPAPVGDGINAPDAPPTPTPTDAQIAEAAEALAMADRELRAEAPTNYVEGILRRLGLPVDAATLAAVVKAAREGAPAVVPEEALALPLAKGGGGLAALLAPAADADAEAAALAIAEAMRTARPPILVFSVKKAKKVARAATGWRSISSKRWGLVVASALKNGLWVAADAFDTNIEIDRVEVQSLTGPDLGYTAAQVARMLPAERVRVWTDDIGADGVSVLPSGVVAAVAPAAVAPDYEETVEEEAERLTTPDEAPDEAPMWRTIYVAAVAPAADEAAAVAPAADEAAAAAVAAYVAVALPFPLVVFVGCLPVGVRVDMTLGALTGPFERAVEQETGLSYYGLVPYAQGPKGVASALRSHLYASPPMWRTIYVDPSHPCAAECLPILAQLPGALVVRST